MFLENVKALTNNALSIRILQHTFEGHEMKIAHILEGDLRTTTGTGTW
jgi:hypothetical protein